MSTATAVGIVELTIDGKTIQAPAGSTIFEAAQLNGIAIPVLCHQQNETPIGVCRVCTVDAGGRVLSAACVRPAENGMKVATSGPKVDAARKTVVELLMADHPSPCAREQQTHDCEMEKLAKEYGVSNPRFPKRLSARGQDQSSFSIAVDHEACILCERCIRGCDEIKHNNVLGRKGKGYGAGIAFDLDVPMGFSSCVSCGECMVSCPTGALTNRAVVSSALQGEPIDAGRLLELDYFSHVSGTFLDLNKHSVVVRHFQAGDVICREGEFGSTAFYILNGGVEVFLESEVAKLAKRVEGGFISKLKSYLASSDTVEKGDGMIPIDAPVDLPRWKPTAELGPGDLFGEMTCMSFYPRSATVRAKTDCTMLEMLRNVLDMIQRNRTMRAKIEANYKKRALETQIRGLPMFRTVTAEFIDELREHVQLNRYTKGDVICQQGEIADSFYLVRIGFVKVTEEHPGGDLVLNYIGKGECFGEIGLLASDGRRTATCTALDHVEVVRIDGGQFRILLERFPEVRRQVESLAGERIAQNRVQLERASAVPLERFLEQGLMEAQSLLLLDLERCTRCDQCVKACADAHDGVTRLIREGLRYDKYLVATSCRQCRDPLCMPGCPVGSIRRKGSLEVIIEDWCIGCGLCAQNCPYGNINMQPITVTAPDPESPTRKVTAVKRKATSCDLCTEHAEPSCVYACPHDAAHRVDPTTFFRFVSGDGARPQ